MIHPPQALLEAKNIEKTYDGRILFRDLSITIFERETVSIQGRSGEGKSTLLHILSGIEPPSHGTLSFKETPFEQLDLDLIRNRSFGFVFQSFHLLEERNVISNVLLPVEIAKWPSEFSKKEWKERAIVLLSRVGLERNIFQKTNTLSGGEKQRVAIARALIMHPAILFLDEPTGNLDHVTSDEIITLLFSLFEEAVLSSLVIITHDPALAKKTNRHFILREGKLI